MGQSVSCCRRQTMGQAQPRRQRQIQSNADPENYSLHPAAFVFRQEIVASVVEENKRLSDEILRLQPLLRFVEEIDLVATVNEEAIRLVQDNGTTWSPNAPSQRRSVAKVMLSQGSIVNGGNGDEEFQISVDELSHRLRLENLGFIGGIGLRMGPRQSWFPRKFSGRGSSVVSVAEDDTVTLAIDFGDELSIRGNLEGLSNEDHVNFKEGQYESHHLDAYFMFPQLPHFSILDSPGATFVPTAIAIKSSSSLDGTLDLIKRAASQSLNGLSITTSPSQELFASTIAALGENEHELLLSTNSGLNVKRDALRDLRADVMRVAISHESQVSRFSLDEGNIAADDEGNPVWCISVESKEHSCMKMNTIGNSVLSISGKPVNGLCMSANMQNTREALFITEFEGEIAVKLPYHFQSDADDMKVEAIGICNSDEFSGDELEDFFDNFPLKVYSAIVGGIVSLTIPKFTDAVKISLKQVRFYPSGKTKELLDAVGLGVGLETSDAVKTSDE